MEVGRPIEGRPHTWNAPPAVAERSARVGLPGGPPDSGACLDIKLLCPLRAQEGKSSAAAIAAANRPLHTLRPVGCLGRLDLDLDVDSSWQVETLEAVDRLRGVVDDVEQALVHAHLEVLAAVLVLVG